MKVKSIDRSVPPPFKTIDSIRVQQVTAQKLDNGIDLFMLSAGSQDITRVELVFRAGMYHQPRTLVASCTNNLLESGTKNFTANQISEGIDFFGSFLELNVEQDYATVTVFSLNKYLTETLRFVAEVVKFPVFPETEFKIQVAAKRQKHAINSQKVNVLAKRRFVSLLFGEKHPYGVDVENDDFDTLRVEDLKKFYKAKYAFSECTIIAAGRLQADLHKTLNEFFGTEAWGETSKNGASVVKPFPAAPGRHFTKRDDALQSAIRIGRLLFNKKHPDYFSFQVLNTVLGGYFGSRLMANIREDKGFTYGIGSGITNLVHSGYFYIATEVGCEFTEAALEEVYREIGKLQQDLIPVSELDTVRNYILGNFLRSVDGSFSLADKFRSIWEYGLDYSFYDNYFSAVKKVTPEHLRDLANRYLRREDLIECVVGKLE